MTKPREPARAGARASALAEPPPPAPLEAQEAAEVLFDVLMAQKKILAGTAKELGLTLQQLAAIRSLSPGEGAPMSTVAEALACDAANVTGIADKLEARGLVKRSGSHDRRVKLLELTDKGLRLRTKIMARLREPTPWISALSREDQRALRDILRRGLAAASVR